ncbi:HAMP domain-containing sensor histidine kinase [Bacillus sp. 165]|uniref:HAMP domain-containing sensor histidine kinase n=1 Tax=Bacillus sp. 165 TaxID=1529117 RepID=UPI001FFE1989|nr:HAMP domain-containing sensor histidine kinase [Bacillus sp. 165]
MNKKIPLLQYWTKRYFIILLCSLVIVALLSGWWIRNTKLENRLRVFELFAQDVAEKLSTFDLQQNGSIHKQIKQRARLFYQNRPFGKNVAIYIVSGNGKVIFQNNKVGRVEEILAGNDMISYESATKEIETSNHTTWYMIGNPIERNERFVGTLYFFVPKSELTSQNRKDYARLSLFLIGLCFSGWLVIYLLSKKLANPIRKVAYAAKQVSKGNYDVEIDEDIPEKELYELTTSFKDMAHRLKQLEELRTMLLAGVTHELKTPVTSIGGCIQAVKDGVVTGDEAGEFLDMSLQEVKRLQSMIEELLDFNAFASGVVAVEHREFSVKELLLQTVQKWQVIDGNETVPLRIEIRDEMTAIGDTNRTQQIILNLLNNAKEAVQAGGEIQVSLYERDNRQLAVDVSDTGTGILAEEQSLIFERFYRGKERNYKKRGLGLGLPLSKMLAEAQGGELVLRSSVVGKGSTFTLLLPKV